MGKLISAGAQVCLKTAPDRVGRITGKVHERAGRMRYEIDFGDTREYVSLGNIEIVEEDEDLYTLIGRGKYGTVKHLRMAMTHIRLSGRLADVIYSMEASNTEFYAYQFKPVINFLNSPSNGLLIADEVGLGKTIEAGLIWTEMRARFDANRLLILAPAVLREKWQEELAFRFGVKADICDAKEMLHRLKQQKSGVTQGFAIISSLQGTRPQRGWEEIPPEDISNHSARAQLAHYLSDHEALESLFDCVVIDEAHYMRNPSSLTHELGKLLRQVSNNLILLSATPIQLKALDLFHLLRLIDPQNFQYEFAFEEIMRANAPILKLSGALRSGALAHKKYLDLLSVCRVHPRFRGNRQLQHLEANAPSSEELERPDLREALATRIDRINILAQVINRTRKRFVHENKVIRKPFAPQIIMTDMERAFYEQVTEEVRSYCFDRDLVDGFILTIPQRQMCSSIPAAFRAWTRRAEEADLALQLFEQGDDGDANNKKGVGPLVELLAGAVRSFADYNQLYQEDSKYITLISQLREYWLANPGKKVVLFSYYRETLRYLKERLDQEGISNQLLYGGMTEKKQEAIARFRNSPDTRILLASEVASEGVDLQFASFLINYDLPWNPMRVEQRIGRIDRIGQKEDRILIHNFFYANTLDDRIYQRLFDRLDIFRHALGDLEAVLGEQVKDLTFDLLSHKMTPEEEEQRIKITEMAVEHIKRTQEELEAEAMHFAAHGDYVLNQVRAAREMKRFIHEDHLLIYVHDFLNEHFPGCRLLSKDDENLAVEIELSSDARADLKEFIDRNLSGRRTRLVSNTVGDKTLCIFSNHVDLASPAHEVINQHHPLVRFVTWKLSEAKHYPLVCARIARSMITEVECGSYFFVVKRWSTTGARVVERLVHNAKLITSDKVISHDDAERLVSYAVDKGSDAFDMTVSFDGELLSKFYDELTFELDDEFELYAEEMKMENEDRVEMMIRAVQDKIDSQVEKLREVNVRLTIAGHQQIVKANLGKIAKLEGHLELKVAKYEKLRSIASVPYQVMAGVVVVE